MGSILFGLLPTSLCPDLREPPPAVCGTEARLRLRDGRRGVEENFPESIQTALCSPAAGEGGGRTAHANTAALSERPRLRSSRCLGHVEISYQDARLMHGDVPPD